MLKDTQKHNGIELGRTGKSKSYARVKESLFFKLLRDAQEGDIFIYDGHGTPDGYIVMRSSKESKRGISGHRLREVMKESKAVLYLNCCFASSICANDENGLNHKLLKNIAGQLFLNCFTTSRLLSDAPVSKEAVSDVVKEVDDFVSMVVKYNEHFVHGEPFDDEHFDEHIVHDERFAEKVAGGVAAFGMGQCPFLDNMVPLSVGILTADLDSILKALGLSEFKRVVSRSFTDSDFEVEDEDEDNK